MTETRCLQVSCFCCKLLIAKVKKWVQVGEQRGAVEAGRIKPGRSVDAARPTDAKKKEEAVDPRAPSRSSGFVGSVSSRELNQYSWLGGLGFFYCGWWVDRQQVRPETRCSCWVKPRPRQITDGHSSTSSVLLLFSLPICNLCLTFMWCVSTKYNCQNCRCKCLCIERANGLIWMYVPYKPVTLCVGVRFLLSECILLSSPLSLFCFSATGAGNSTCLTSVEKPNIFFFPVELGEILPQSYSRGARWRPSPGAQ